MRVKLWFAIPISVALALSVCSASAQKEDADGRQLIEAPFTGTPPTIDGVLNTGEWTMAASNTVDFTDISDTGLGVAGNSGPGVSDGPEDVSYTFHVQYDSTYLYVGVAVKDDIYVSTNYGRRLQWDLPVTWLNDSVEFFFDGDLSRSTESARNPTETETGGQWIHGLGTDDTPLPFVSPELYGEKTRPFGLGPNDDWYAQTKVDANTADWVQEARFKLSIIGSPKAGQDIGFNIGVDDVDTVDEQSMEPEHYVEVRDIQLYWTVFERVSGQIVTESVHEFENLWGTLRFLQPTDVSNWSVF